MLKCLPILPQLEQRQSQVLLSLQKVRLSAQQLSPDPGSNLQLPRNGGRERLGQAALSIR